MAKKKVAKKKAAKKVSGPPKVDEKKYTSFGLRNLRRKGLIR